MKPVTKDEISNSFIQTPKDLFIPDLSDIEWDKLEYLGWIHRSGHRGYISAVHQDKIVSLELDIQPSYNSNLYKTCSLCHTQHISTGISLFSYTIKRPQYKTYGEWICSNLQCSKYLRGELDSHAIQMREDLQPEDKIIRLKINLDDYISRYLKTLNYP